MTVHRTALVDAQARLGAGVEVGPYAVIGPGVVIGDRCRIGPHACLYGPLELGEECVVAFSAALGHEPQVSGAAGPFGAVRIGARNVFREFSQVHRSLRAAGETVIGNDCYLMTTAHVAHDCTLGDRVVMCNAVMLGGHVEVGDRAFLGGGAGIHQFARVGEVAMIGGNASVALDAPPFCTLLGDRPTALSGLNVVGLRRAGVAPDARRALKQAYRTIFRSKLPLAERLEAVDASVPEVARLVAFIATGKRGVTGLRGRPRLRGRTGDA